MASISNVRTAAFHPTPAEPEVAGHEKGNELKAGGAPQNVLQGLNKAGEAFRLHQASKPQQWAANGLPPGGRQAGDPQGLQGVAGAFPNGSLEYEVSIDGLHKAERMEEVLNLR